LKEVNNLHLFEKKKFSKEKRTNIIGRPFFLFEQEYFFVFEDPSFKLIMNSIVCLFRDRIIKAIKSIASGGINMLDAVGAEYGPRRMAISEIAKNFFLNKSKFIDVFLLFCIAEVQVLFFCAG
jgi:hypothetical protein